jgi:hypothetical protein
MRGQEREKKARSGMGRREDGTMGKVPAKSLMSVGVQYMGAGWIRLATHGRSVQLFMSHDELRPRDPSWNGNGNGPGSASRSVGPEGSGRNR